MNLPAVFSPSPFIKITAAQNTRSGKSKQRPESVYFNGSNIQDGENALQAFLHEFGGQPASDTLIALGIDCRHERDEGRSIVLGNHLVS